MHFGAPPLFPPPSRRQMRENIVPMINVVFLLLIFFMISAHLAPPDPVAVTLPHAQTEARAQAGQSLVLTVEGMAAFGAARGDAALAGAARAASEAGGPLRLRADANADAAALARVLSALARLGVTDVLMMADAP